MHNPLLDRFSRLILAMLVISLVSSQTWAGTVAFISATKQIQLPAGGGTTSVQHENGSLVVERNDIVRFREKAAGIQKLMITGTPDEDDTFRIYLTEEMRGTVLVEGGSGGFDVLDIRDGAYDHVTFRYINSHDGSIAYDFDGDRKTDFTIEYTGLEPITSSITASNVTLSFGNSSEAVTITDAGGGQTKVDSTAGEAVTFINPTNSLTINAGGGDDQIVIDSFGITGSVNVVIDGQGGYDSFTLNSNIGLGTGSFSAKAEACTISDQISSASGGISITADTLDLGGVGGFQSAGVLSIAPVTNTTTIGLGGGSGTLSLSDMEIGLLSDGFADIVIGSASSGDISIETAVFTDRLTLISGTAIHDGSGTDLTAPGIEILGTISPGLSPGILTVSGDFSFADGAVFLAELGGTSPGTAAGDHDQVNVSGAVTIAGNVALSTSAFGGYLPSGSESYLLVSNGGGGAVNGTFAGLAEGATISSDFLGSGLIATISYIGGDGNDVVIVVAPVPVDLQSFTVAENRGQAQQPARAFP